MAAIAVKGPTFVVLIVELIEHIFTKSYAYATRRPLLSKKHPDFNTNIAHINRSKQFYRNSIIYLNPACGFRL